MNDIITKEDMNEGQSNALKQIIQSIEDNTHITLSGSAGTGKTTTTRIL